MGIWRRSTSFTDVYKRQTINGGRFETQDTLVSVVCMVAGAALGEWINIEYKLQQLGAVSYTHLVRPIPHLIR